MPETETKHWELAVLSPQKPIFQGMARYIEVPSAGGVLGLLPKHAPSVILLSAGDFRIFPEEGLAQAEGQENTKTAETEQQSNSKSKRYFIQGGFLQIKGNQITALIEELIPSEQRDQTVQAQAKEEWNTLQKEKTRGKIALELQYRRISRLRSRSSGYTAVF